MSYSTTLSKGTPSVKGVQSLLLQCGSGAAIARVAARVGRRDVRRDNQRSKRQDRHDKYSRTRDEPATTTFQPQWCADEAIEDCPASHRVEQLRNTERHCDVHHRNCDHARQSDENGSQAVALVHCAYLTLRRA